MVLPIAAPPAAGENSHMSPIRLHQLDQRLHPVFSRTERVTASALFGRSCRLLDAAQGLEREAGGQRGGGDDDGAVAAIEHMAPTLEAIANASLLLSLMARELLRQGQGDPARAARPLDGDRNGDGDHVTRLLYGASQNIRIAAEASRLAAEAVRPASPSTV
jgi:hypothetical protein